MKSRPAAAPRAGLAATGLVALLLGCRAADRLPNIPASGFAPISAGTYRIGSAEAGERNPPRTVQTGGFAIGRHPVTVRLFAEYLNETGTPLSGPVPDLARRGTHWRVRIFRGNRPVRGISREEARAFCVWFSKRHGVSASLPSADQWEIAARGGIEGARYPWGWGPPRGRARFSASSPSRVGRYPPNGFGLSDMAGNVFQWASDSPDPETAIACGGAWSEPEARRLRVFERTAFPITYRGDDVGFRILIEPLPPAP